MADKTVPCPAALAIATLVILLFDIRSVASNERGCEADLAEFKPLSSNPTLSEIQDSYAQLALVRKSLPALTVPLSNLLANNRTYPAVVLMSYLEKNVTLMAKVYEMARELQCGVNYKQGLATVSASFSKLTKAAKASNSNTAFPTRKKSAFQTKETVKASVGNDSLAHSAMTALSPMYSSDKVLQVVAELMDVAADVDTNQLNEVGRQMFASKKSNEQAHTNQASNKLARKGATQDLLALPSGGYIRLSPSSVPALRVPVVFNVLLFKSGDDYGPPGYQNATRYAARMLEVVNMQANTNNVHFFIHAVRASPLYSGLVMDSYAEWSACTFGEGLDVQCPEVVANQSVSFPRAVQVYVVGDGNSFGDTLGYAFVPSSQTDVLKGHIFLRWDQLDATQSNSEDQLEAGAHTLWHELMHHFGMPHTFDDNDDGRQCSDDGIVDTPTSRGPVWEQRFGNRAQQYCLDLWQNTLRSNWTRVKERWATTFFIPPEDRNSWGDSCPDASGFDELGNYITYTYDSCVVALGHMTSAQITGMHMRTTINQPVLYQWGQWYAQNTFAIQIYGGCATQSTTGPGMYFMNCASQLQQRFTFIDGTVRSNYDGNCMAVSCERSGCNVHMLPCNGRHSQQWSRVGSSLVNQLSGRCLQHAWDYRLVVADCSQSNSQQVRFVSAPTGDRGYFASRHNPNACIAIEDRDAVAAACTQGSEAHLFTWSGRSIAPSSNSSLCMNAACQQAGCQVDFKECDKSAAQSWLVDSQGRMRIMSSLMCLDFSVDTDDIILWPCHGRLNQRFDFIRQPDGLDALA